MIKQNINTVLLCQVNKSRFEDNNKAAIKSSRIWIVKLLGQEIGHHYLDHVSNHPPGATRREAIGRGWKQAERHGAKRR